MQFHVERSERFVDENKVAQLNLSLYGTRDAAMNCTKCYTKLFTDNGFVTGRANPRNFYHPERQVSLTVHGGDFTSTGRERDLKWLEKVFAAKFEEKTQYLGPAA